MSAAARAAGFRYTLARLSRVSVGECVCRGRQAAARWWERMHPPEVPWRDPAAFLARHAPELGGTDAVDHFRAAIGARFFPGATTLAAPVILDDRLPLSSGRILDRADRICEGRFDLLGYSDLRFGDPIDWAWDPVSDQRAPLCHWSRIDPLDREMVGDSKVTWELNRHQWLVTLGQADRMTGDPRYSRAAARLFDSWLEDNPPGRGINWSSSLEVAFRLIAWCWALALFSGSSFLTPERLGRIAAAVWAHARYVERYLSYYFSPNTHLTGEALGLFYAGVVFQEFRESARWRDLGRRILIAESRRQVTADGVHFEQATCYHRYTIEIYLHFLVLAARNGVAVPAEVEETFDRMLDFFAAICPATGRMPRVGDEDGGWLMPLADRWPDDCRGVAAAAATWRKHRGLAWMAGGLAPEVVWLFGREGVASFDRLRTGPPAIASQAFRTGGYVVMRDGWHPDAQMLLFDTGPLGCSISGAHGHADLLSVQFWAGGEPYLVDPGTYCYTAEPRWRDHFRSTRAHNTITVDDQPQAETHGVFAWKQRPSARLRDWQSLPEIEIADAEHHAYTRLATPVVHRRRVIFLRSGAWILVDDLLGSGEHTVDLRFQFSPRAVVAGPAPWFLAAGAAGGVWIGTFSSVAVARDVRCGGLDPIDGWISPAYGRRRPAPLVAIGTRARLPLSFVTLLVPVPVVAGPPPIDVHAGDGEHRVLRADGVEALRIGTDLIELTAPIGSGRR